MRLAFLAVAALAVIGLSGPAFADNCIGAAPICNNTSNTTNNQGGTGVGVGVGIGGKGGDASANSLNVNGAKSTVKNSGNSENKNTNRNQNAATAVQGQSQGQDVTIENPRPPVSSAFAPGLTSSIETCMGSTSIGGQGVGFGLSIGSTWTDDACQARMDARFALGFNAPMVAKARLCTLESWQKAFAEAGEPCGQATTMVPAKPEASAEPQEPTESEKVAEAPELPPLY